MLDLVAVHWKRRGLQTGHSAARTLDLQLVLLLLRRRRLQLCNLGAQLRRQLLAGFLARRRLRQRRLHRGLLRGQLGVRRGGRCQV